MKTRWKAFMRKIFAKSEDIPFSKVIAYLQKYLLPYWNHLNQ